MEIAKSLFAGSRTHEGYAGREDYNEKVDTALSEDDTTDLGDAVDGLTIAAEGLAPAPGGPFSALTPSMWPQDLLGQLGKQSEDPNSQPDYRFDEFGFRVEEEDGPEPASNRLLGVPLTEDAAARLAWVAHLEFSHASEGAALTWDALGSKLARTDRLRALVRQGIPHSLRPQMWMRLSGALAKKQSMAGTSYREVVRASGQEGSGGQSAAGRQIERDLLRTLPANVCFSHAASTGVPRLRRLLRGLAWLYPDIGYCQGMGMMAASLLLLLEEEDAFWVMCTIVEDLLPASYYCATLVGVQADQRVLRELVAQLLPDLDGMLRRHDIELSLIALPWFLTLFASVVHTKVLLRLWDLLFCDGSTTLFKAALGMLKMREADLGKLENSAAIFNALSAIPGDIEDVDALIETACEVGSSLNEVTLETQRRRHLAYLMAEQGALVCDPDTSHLPKQHLARRQVKKSKSMIQLLLFGEEVSEDDIKSKNIRQTELLVCLREAVLSVARHFPGSAALAPDYSMASHAADHDRYAAVARNRKRRAKALLDFERHDDDELGFRKNDVITVVSQKDEHCWVGELNGLRGWFPAKFVEVLDERSKQYSCAGDDSVSEAVTDLVRGTLCPAVKQLLEHGMRRPSFLGGPCHPWLFVEEAAAREVERDFNSVYSRLVLCKTYRLDEDGKVLTPEELLYRCVQSVNQSHHAAQMDVKLRSLVCLGLNEQALHLWLEVLCSCADVVTKWYQPWSFVCSPGWVQLKCELRVLAQFAFSLNPDWELPARREQSQPLRDGVRDMLVKHHLFSWDL